MLFYSVNSYKWILFSNFQNVFKFYHIVENPYGSRYSCGTQFKFIFFFQNFVLDFVTGQHVIGEFFCSITDSNYKAEKN